MGWNTRVGDFFSFPDRKKPEPKRGKGMSLGLMLFIIAAVLILASALAYAIEDYNFERLSPVAARQIEQLYDEGARSSFTIVRAVKVDSTWHVVVEPPVVIHEQQCRKLRLWSENIARFGTIWHVEPDSPCN